MDKEITNADGSRNWEANILFDNIKRLEQENAELKAYKDVNEDFKKAWEELRAKDDRLKEEDEIRDNLSETYRKEALSWANIANECQKDKTKLETDNKHLNDLLDNALKEQEELKEQNDGLKSQLDFEIQRRVRAEDETEQLEDEYSKLVHNYKELQEENERLKEENYQLHKHCQICENFIDGIPCKPLRDMDYDLQKVINQRDKYIEALAEIKEICKNSHTSASEDYYRTADKILQKINEVIGAEE